MAQGRCELLRQIENCANCVQADIWQMKGEIQFSRQSHLTKYLPREIAMCVSEYGKNGSYVDWLDCNLLLI